MLKTMTFRSSPPASSNDAVKTSSCDATAATVVDEDEKDCQEEDTTQTYAMQVVLEEVATLRKRVKELEQHGDADSLLSTADRSGGTVDSSVDEEISNLRKEIARHEDEKATMELDFMNQLSQIQRANAEQVDQLNDQIKLLEKEKEQTKEETQPAKEDEETSSSSNSQADGDNQELIQVRQDLESADKELEISRKDIDTLTGKIKKLEVQKTALIEEVTTVRMELENQSKVITTLQAEMEETERHFKNQSDKLSSELKNRDAIIANQQRELSQMNETSIGFEGKKAMLLDEITDLRMQLDRDEKIKQELRKKVEEMAMDQSESQRKLEEELKSMALPQEDENEEAQEKIQQLESELRSLTTSYKSNMSRVEENLSFKESELEAERKLVQAKDESLKDEKETNKNLMNEIKDLRSRCDEQSALANSRASEIATLESQRASFERRMTESIEEHVSQLDTLKEEKCNLLDQVQSLQNQLGEAKTDSTKMKLDLDSELEKSKQLKIEIEDLKAAAAKAAAANSAKKSATLSGSPPPSPSPAPSYISRSTSSPKSPPFQSPFKNKLRGKSPSPRSNEDSPSRVKNLAARFEKQSDETDDASVGSNRSNASLIGPPPVPRSPHMMEVESRQRELEGELAESKEQIDLLQEKLQKQCEVIGELHAEIATLKATRSAIQALSRKEYEKQSLNDKAEVERLQNELADIKKQLNVAERQAKDLKGEIKNLTSNRIKYEESAMDSYERRVAANQKSHDAELNKLKVELTNERMAKAQMERDHKNQIKDMEAAIEELNIECDNELEEKQAELDAMQQQFNLQTDELRRLRAEKDQLCLGINNRRSSRRGELEELQEELMKKTTENASMAREIQKLEMQVEYQQDQKAELESLRKEIKDLELRARPTGTQHHIQRMEFESIQAENRRLRDQIHSGAIERRSLQEKLNAAISERKQDRSMQVLRQRNEKLKKEVERLNRRLSGVAGNVTRIAI